MEWALSSDGVAPAAWKLSAYVLYIWIKEASLFLQQNKEAGDLHQHLEDEDVVNIFCMLCL